ncbi:hypothetical protein SAMN05216480_10544 [Pustulibacterium marinum]|uniref:Uncharacterized protein n=1 Tax=Pustulibacterium marinum TaxID=1224947 RepID=A0A1I7GL00_9FLAO|nr:hypothetical protein [Pustulibacterium marinum]SFU49105.1 hypothetical protein SAMN05216480_10544 [Pustulibacterium marinum]
MNIEQLPEGDIYYNESVAFTYQVGQTPKDFEEHRGQANSVDFESQRNFLGDYAIIPYGTNDSLPHSIKEAVQNNFVAPGILKRKTNLLWGKGPRLYKEVVEGDKLKRVWDDAPTNVQAWLNSWDYIEYLMKECVDYQHLEAGFTKFHATKGRRVNKPSIAFLEHIPANRANLAIHKNTPNGGKPTHIVTTDWSFEYVNSFDYKAYPVFDLRNPVLAPTSMFYSNMYSFCSEYYTVPDLYGSLEWLRRSTAVPLIFKALTKNSINLKYHIISPQAFWDKAEEKIQEKCTKVGKEYKPAMLAQYKKEFVAKIGDVLSGSDNVGKYLHTTKTLEVDGTNILEHGWEVKVIDQNIKDFVAAQIEISKHSASAIATGVSLGASLANTSDQAKANSGNEQYYAMINYLNTDVNIPEIIVTKAINYAIQFNFPETDYRIGFYHSIPERTSDLSPNERIDSENAA